MEGKGDKATAEGMELLRKEVDKMKEELKTSEDGLYTFPRKIFVPVPHLRQSDVIAVEVCKYC